jgi:tetratricopeptide (TPR) repeat protein
MKYSLTIIFSLLFFFSFSLCSFRKDVNDGNRLFYKQKYDEAVEKYNSAEIKKPNNAILYYNRGNAFYKQQSYEQAIKEYQKSLGLTKDKDFKSKILYNMGNAYLKLGDFQKARDSYIQGLKLNPNDEDIKYNLQYALVEINQPQQLQKQNSSSDKSQNQQQKNKQEQQEQKKYMSEQDVQRLIESVNQQQKDKLKEALKPQKPQLPQVDKDW